MASEPRIVEPGPAPPVSAVEQPAPLVQFKDVGKSFELAQGERLEAVRDIDLSVAAGEFVTLVGPSGCGKSTILNMTAGLMTPTSGSVLYAGEAVGGINGRVGYMTQNDHLLPWRTVAGNIEVPLEIKGLGRRERRDRVSHLMDLVGLTGFEDSYPSQVSGGMRKRAALARLLAYDPDTLLMDEPFGALDAQLRLTLQSELLRIRNKLNKTILFVTHDLDEAIALADRCVVFSGRPGSIVRILETGLPRERDLVELRFDRRFLELARGLWETLTPKLNRTEETVR